MATATWNNDADFSNGESLSTIRTNINNFNEDILADVEAVETSVSSLDSRTTSTESDITVIQGDVTSLQTTTTTLQSSVGVIETEVTELQVNAPFAPIYEYVQGASITVPSDTYTEIARLTTASIPSGVYKLTQSMLYSLDSTTTSAYFRFSINGGATWQEIRREPKDNTDTLPSAYTQTVTHTGGVFEVIIQSRKENAGDILTVGIIDIIFERKL